MVLRDPKPGDGSFSTGPIEPDSDPVELSDPVSGGLSPTRTPAQREAIAEVGSPR